MILGKNNFKNNLIFILIVILIILIYILFINNKNNNYINNLNLQLQDSIEIYKNKDSLQEAKIKVLEIQSYKDLKNIEGLKGINKELQKELDKNTKSISIVKTNTVIYDTIYVDSIKGLTSLKTIKDNFNNIKYGVINNSPYLYLDIKNDFKIKIKEETKSIFSKPYNVAYLTNLNPRTNIINFKVMNVDIPEQKRLGIGVHIGYGLSNFYNSGITVSVGLNYNIINIK